MVNRFWYWCLKFLNFLRSKSTVIGISPLTITYMYILLYFGVVYGRALVHVFTTATKKALCLVMRNHFFKAFLVSLRTSFSREYDFNPTFTGICSSFHLFFFCFLFFLNINHNESLDYWYTNLVSKYTNFKLHHVLQLLFFL